jgi:cold shock CspA family protein
MQRVYAVQCTAPDAMSTAHTAPWGAPNNATVPSASSSQPRQVASPAQLPPQPPIGPAYADPMAAVFADDDLLTLILWNMRGLAPLHSDFQTIVGWRSSYPNDWSDPQHFRRPFFFEESYLRDCRRRWSTVLVCKHWHALNTGARGLQAWTDMASQSLERALALNRIAASDPDLPWLYRLCAMAAANDVAGLKRALGEPTPHSRALAHIPTTPEMVAAERFFKHMDYKENRYEEGDEECHIREEYLVSPAAEKAVRLHRRHLLGDPMYLIECMECGGLGQAILCVAGLNAVEAGAVEALNVILAHVPQMWEFQFDEKGNSVLHYAIEYACKLSCLEGPVNGIRALLAKAAPLVSGRPYYIYEFRRELNRRVRGSNGGPLHIAAACGHVPLVKVLLAAGFDRASARRDQLDSFDTGSRQMHTPQAWAQKRGQAAVVELLRQRAPNRPLRLALPRPGDTQANSARCGTLVRFEVARGFGFIQPDDGDDSIFVHINVLRAGTQAGASRKRPRPSRRPQTPGGYPWPGQRLVFRAQRGRRGMRATMVADGGDGSWLELPLRDQQTAQQLWSRYHDDRRDNM